MRPGPPPVSHTSGRDDRGHDIVAAVADAEALRSSVDQHRPDLAVVDIRMPPTFIDEDTRAARSIKDAYPSLGVLVLSQHIDTNHAVALVSRPGFGYRWISVRTNSAIRICRFSDGRRDLQHLWAEMGRSGSTASAP